MMAGMYAAISGLDANQAMLNETAANLANVNTVGYKASSVTFADSLTQVIRGASAPTATTGGSNPVQIGLGVQIDATRNEMTEGAFQTTGNPLDVAIQGQGFLRVGAGRTAGQTTVHGRDPGEDHVHPRRRPVHEHARLPHHAGGQLRDRPQRGGERRRNRNDIRARHGRHLHPGCLPGSTNVSIGMDGSVGYTDNNPEDENLRAARRRRLPLARHVRERSRSRTDRRLAVGDHRRTPARRSSARRTPSASARPWAASSRCPTSTSPPR